MKNYKYYKGTFDADSLPRKPSNYPWAIIVNTQTDVNPNVGHWVSFVWDKRNKVTFYDSYGSQPLKEWKHFLKSINGQYSIVRRKTQKWNTATCGYLSMDFIRQRIDSIRKSNNTIVSKMSGRKSYNKFR